MLHMWYFIIKKLWTKIRVSHKHLIGEGRSIWSIGGSIWCRDGKDNQQLVGGAVYISSYQQTCICNNSLVHSCAHILELYWRETGIQTYIKLLLKYSCYTRKIMLCGCPRTMSQCIPLDAPDMWSLINFEWDRGGHLHHNMSSIFVPTQRKVGILHIGHITDPPVIWPV